MIEPRVERKAERRQAGETLAKAAVREQTRRRPITRVHDGGIRIPRGDVADAPEPAAAGVHMCLEHRLDAMAQPQVGMADDTRTDPGGTIASARAHCGDAVDELGLPDRR